MNNYKTIRQFETEPYQMKLHTQRYNDFLSGIYVAWLWTLKVTVCFSFSAPPVVKLREYLRKYFPSILD